MAIPSSGPLSFTTIQTEFGGSNPIGLNEYYAGGAYVPAGTTGTNGAVPSSGALAINKFYGTSASITINYLVVGGGAGGGWYLFGTGGGGSGGIKQFSCIAVVAGVTYTITVGGGGSGGLCFCAGCCGNIEIFPSNGANSSIVGSAPFVNQSGIGGGRGASRQTGGRVPGVGGGGGGGSSSCVSTTGGAGCGAFRGGNGNVCGAKGGGGGGAGGAGGDANTNANQTPPSGGIGVLSSITGTATYYAGGGGAANCAGRVPFGAGGAGGGGNGNSGSSSVAGSGGTNLGGGGGASGFNPSTRSGNGGSGVVIVSAPVAAVAYSGAAAPTCVSGRKVYRFTSSGSIRF